MSSFQPCQVEDWRKNTNITKWIELKKVPLYILISGKKESVYNQDSTVPLNKSHIVFKVHHHHPQSNCKYLSTRPNYRKYRLHVNMLKLEYSEVSC